jgi:hypothetical protein
VAQGKLRLDLVAVPAAMSLAEHIALVDQLGEDLVGTALGDPDGSGDIAQSDAGVMGDAEEDMGVVGEEVPAASHGLRSCLPLFSRIIVHEFMLHYSQSRKEAFHAWDPQIAFPRGVTHSGGLADLCGVADATGLARSDRNTRIGHTKMTFLNSQRFKRLILGREVDVAGEVDVAEPSQSDDSPLPIPGYDRIKDKDLVAELSEHSQAELAAIETYERSHKKRQAVFDKLRYLRGQEPLQGYDALSVEEILVGLEGADVGTLQRTRVYERKFQRRPDVLKDVATSIRGHRPASVHRG